MLAGNVQEVLSSGIQYFFVWGKDPLRLFFVSRVHPASFITLRSFYIFYGSPLNTVWSHMVSLQVRFPTYAAENRFLFCRGPGSLPVLVGASFAVQKGDPFAHQEHTIWPNLWEIHSISFPIGLAFWRGVPLCGLLFSLLGLLQVLMLVFSLSLGIYRVSDFLSLCLQSMWDYASFYSSSFCLFCFNSFPVPFVQCFMFSLCSIQCHEFQQCIWRRTLCWQSEWPRSTPSLFSSIPYSFAIAKDNVSPMKQSRQGVDLEKVFFFFRELIESLLHSVCKCEHDNGSLLALNCYRLRHGVWSRHESSCSPTKAAMSNFCGYAKQLLEELHKSNHSTWPWLLGPCSSVWVAENMSSQNRCETMFLPIISLYMIYT